MLDVFFLQAGAVLFTEAPSLDVLRSCFADYSLTPTAPSPQYGADMLPFQGPGLSLVWNARTGETAEIDLQTTPWPDDLGEGGPPNSTLAASAIGAFGPGAVPGGFTRAQQQAWHWREAAAVTGQHRAFVRIRLKGSMFHSGEKSLPGEGLLWLLRAAERIAKLPGALAWFCPSAELLLSPAQLSTELAEAAANGRPPVHAICSVRLWTVGDWKFLDTAGMAQSLLPDLEFAGPAATTDVEATATAFINLCLYLMTQGDVIQSGNTADGPAGKWLAVRCGRGVHPPQRNVLRWLYPDSPQPPPTLALQEPQPPAPPPVASPAASGEPLSDEKEEVLLIMEVLLEEFAEWQAGLPAAREHLARFQHTADYFVLGAGLTKADSLHELAMAMRGAVLIPAVGVMSNSDKSLPLRPALALGTFDPRPEAYVRCSFLKEKMYSLYGQPKATDPADRALQKIINDDKYETNKRVRIPEPFAGGFEIYAFSVLLTPDDEEHGETEECSILPLLTAPGPAHAPAIVIPLPVLRGKTIPSIYTRITGEAPPPPEAILRDETRRSKPLKRKQAGRLSLGRVLLIGICSVLLLGALSAIFGGDRKPKKKGDEKTLIDRFEEKLEQKRREKSKQP